MKQKAEITLEVEETIILRQVAETLTAFCPQCQALVKMTSSQTIADFSAFTDREVFRLSEVGKLPFIETERIYGCLRSLTAFEKARTIHTAEAHAELGHRKTYSTVVRDCTRFVRFGQ